MTSNRSPKAIRETNDSDTDDALSATNNPSTSTEPNLDPTIDDILPPPTHPSLSQLLSSLRRTNLTIHNRLTSILSDADFVRRASASFPGRPLIANERCGSWYVCPRDKVAGAYFKSTDGHERAWKFSTRRLNLHLVEMAEKCDGVFVVDSTRRGKRMPDALSTTIPIWCTVLNLALLPSHPLSPNLFLPPSLPSSTHSQITALISSFLASLTALNLPLPLNTLTKPLRPFWITQDSPLSEDEPLDVIYEEYRPVICCTASRRVVAGSEMEEGGYIQGAGDDTENWAHGLTPVVFWEHVDELIGAPEAELPALITKLVEQHDGMRQNGSGRIQVAPQISVCCLPLDTPSGPPKECHILLTSDNTPQDQWIKSPSRMEVGLGKNKPASRNLRLALPEISRFACKFMSSAAAASTSGDSTERHAQLVIACESGKDLSIGAALALSCYLFDEHGQFRTPDEKTTFTKTKVKTKLGSIMAAYPEANPNRQTLQSVNSFLMDWR